MARASKSTKFGLKINVMIGWILCTPRLSEWSRLGLASPSGRPELGHATLLPIQGIPLVLKDHPNFPRFLPFFLRLQRSGPRKPGKWEVQNYNSAELRNQRSYEAYKQIHFREATSYRRIRSFSWHLGDNKRSKQPKKLPPIPFFCESSIKYDSEIIILTGSPHQVGKSGKSRKFCDGLGSRTMENEVLKNFMFLRPKIYKLPRPSG